MEIKCMHCGEGWDVMSIHDISTVNNIVGGVVTTAGDPWRLKWSAFLRYGCGAFDIKHKRCSKQPVDKQGAALMSAAVDVLGDDIDGIAVMIEDYEGGY